MAVSVYIYTCMCVWPHWRFGGTDTPYIHYSDRCSMTSMCRRVVHLFLYLFQHIARSLSICPSVSLCLPSYILIYTGIDTHTHIWKLSARYTRDSQPARQYSTSSCLYCMARARHCMNIFLLIGKFLKKSNNISIE